MRPIVRRCLLAGLASFAIAPTAQGCASILDIPDAPELVPSGPWSCLGSEPEVQPALSPRAKVRISACDFVSNCSEPVTNLTAKLCLKRDVGCTNPIAQGIMDKNGLFEFDVDATGNGFDGYLDVSAKTALCTDKDAFGDTGAMLCGLLPNCNPDQPSDACQAPTYAHALVFFNPPVRQSLDKPLPLPLLPSTALPAIVGAAGAKLDPTTGNLFITALDCSGNPVAGVTFGISEHQDKVTQLYVDHGVVSNTSLQTDSSGIGGFVDVPPGFAEVTAYNSKLQTIGKIGVQAAPFTLTYSTLSPFTNSDRVRQLRCLESCRRRGSTGTPRGHSPYCRC